VSGWTVALLIADVIGVTLAVIRAAYPPPEDAAGAVVRRIRLAEAGLAGSLVALVAWQAEALGLLGVLGLVAMALVAGESLRFALAADELARQTGPGSSAPAMLGALTAILSLTVVALVVVTGLATGPPPAPPVTALDSRRFGVSIFDHESSVPTRTLSGPPTLADADVAGGVAAPVERYHLENGVLTLVVSHHLTCRAAAVLLGPDAAAPGAVLDVVVVYGPSRLTPSAAPSGSAQGGGCQPENPLVVRSVVEVAVPAGLSASTVRDVGGDGAAKPVR
jgi:hypothetical protein